MGGISILYENITKDVLRASFDVHNLLGYGFLEKVYESALAYELELCGFDVERQKHLTVYYKDIEAGNYYADLIVEGKVLIELKTCEKLKSEHVAQTLNYLKATRIKVGLLINFGKDKVEFKRLVY